MARFHTYRELDARHYTGRTRHRQGMFGRLILQLEIKSPKPAYPRTPSRTDDRDVWENGFYCIWKDAKIEDMVHFPKTLIGTADYTPPEKD